MKEGNSNFGGIFVFWDYVFSTVSSEGTLELAKMKLGIDINQSPDKMCVNSFLKNPFKLG
jgi:sterol desaturase/sphingolipid hydroxylase (fatty acid hydroxylase superfamily)